MKKKMVAFYSLMFLPLVVVLIALQFLPCLLYTSPSDLTVSLGGLFFAFPQQIFFVAVHLVLFFFGQAPVSYTHLDVYKRQLCAGIDTLANTVKITLGPKGRNVVLGKKFGAPVIDVYKRQEFEVDALKGYDEDLKDQKPSKMNWATPGGSWAEGETAGLHTYVLSLIHI